MPSSQKPQSNTPITESDFHKVIHSSVGTPTKKYIKIGRGRLSRRQPVSKEHQCHWASTSVDLKRKLVKISVYIDFQNNRLTTTQYAKLKQLAIMGIGEYWSRKITIDGKIYSVHVNVTHRAKDSIDVDLKINDKPNYARSNNSGLIDASFIYNQGRFKGNLGFADIDFKLVSAHEFGHSVLMYFGDTGLSWGHKGTTSALLQSVKKTTPGYPIKGEIDLMKYYDTTKNSGATVNQYQRTRAAEQDIKRLIWMSNITFTS